ncbi:PIG-L deacetylase family protein [Myxosarcina sp. GI1]|uniref:PIG-L deacetylase family protein n=1 Tax=Myxosarcina sp. GI1 TaxID=1541065 RepID=UPI00056BBD95|nr:PIG-L family deacetylase [Myxosarcina sp. GI1]
MTAIVNRSLFDEPESLPLLSIQTLVNLDSSGCVLIVAPHPDDEALGCGGAIALLRQLDLSVNVLVVSDGTKSHPNSQTYPPPALKKLRERESLAALKILGVESKAVTFWGLPDGAVNTYKASQEAIAHCYNFLTALAPSMIFLPWRKDPHADHRASWQIFTTASQRLPKPPQLIEYPIWDWDRQQRGSFTESLKAWRLDISSVLELKLRAIAQYRSQISDLIDDDPQGFRLTPQILQNFTRPWEIYLQSQ